MRVNVERGRTQKSDQRLIAFPGKIGSKRRRRRDRSDYGNTGRERFLHDFERSAAAHQKEMLIQWQRSVQKRAANRLVHSVMTTDIFAHNPQLTLRIKNSCGMDSLGA